MAGIDLRDANGERYTVRLCRRPEAGNFTAEERGFLNLLAGHIERSVAHGMRMVQMDSERQLHTSAVSGRSIGSITLDAGCQVLRTNGAADMILAAKDGIAVHRGQLQTRQPELNERLREMMQEMLEAQRREEVVPAHAMAIPRSSGKADYELVIKAIPVDRYVETRNSPHLLVLINDPDTKPTVSMSALMNLYQLTNAEARISVLLSQGKTLDDVSKELGIARNTARAHLRAIYSKTGVTQQSMLVSLVLKSLASHP
jgi:DNA-binding CsgD family transcriptional regulator